MPETTIVRPASKLEKGSRIYFLKEEVTIRKVIRHDDWVTLYFEKPVWDPHTEMYVQTHGCHSGFCLEVIEK